MALTRAQLLMGNSSQGTILTNQVQGVRQGPGITINADGTIEVNSQTVVGLMKLGQTAAIAAAAYNGYTWPTTLPGTSGRQLTVDTAGNLTWSDADGIPWTAKGQLVVGTGVNSDTLLNVGADGAILIADSTSTSGLAYTANYVATFGPTTVALMPAGNTAARPALAVGQAGALRYNSTTVAMEFWNGTAWEEVASSSSNGFVQQTSATGSAVMPTGTTLQRDASPAAGFTRFNTTNVNLEVWDGTAWTAVGAPPTAGLGISITGTVVKVSIPTASTPPAVGAGAAQAVVGSMYWDDTLNQLFIYYSNGGTPVWVQAAPAASSSSLTAASLAEAAAGIITTKYSSPATAVPKDAANMTGAAIIPGGVDGGRPGTPSGGMFRYNTTYTPDTMEYYDGTAASWKRLVNYDQLSSVAIDGYSITVNGLVANDLPSVAPFLALTWIDIPVGYTNLFVTSTYQAFCAYNTTGQPALQPYNYTTYGPAPGPSNANTISFQSVVFGGGANFQGTGMTVNGSGSVSGLNPATSYSVGVYGVKATGGGQVQVYDISINVLAWNVNP